MAPDAFTAKQKIIIDTYPIAEEIDFFRKKLLSAQTEYGTQLKPTAFHF